jgi:hypothetical protein
MTRMNDPRRDWKILVAVGLSGSQFARAGHQELATFIWHGAYADAQRMRGIACPI